MRTGAGNVGGRTPPREDTAGGMPAREGGGWREISRAGLIAAPGNAVRYETGDWRTLRPLFHPDRCIQCLLCWVYCPDAAIEVKDGLVVGVDYKHCKGCGICATECPDKAHALEMAREDEAEGET